MPLEIHSFGQASAWLPLGNDENVVPREFVPGLGEETLQDRNHLPRRLTGLIFRLPADLGSPLRVFVRAGRILLVTL